MSVCELTGKKPVVKNLVSHSNIKTKRKIQPNVQQKRLYSELLKGFVSLKVATSTLRTIDHRGGFDHFILQQDPRKLSPRALKVLKRIQAKMHKSKN